MKKLLIATLLAAALSLPTVSHAGKKPTPTPTPAAGASGAALTPAATPEPAAGKRAPMNARVDTIDTSAKTFTSKKKDGTEVVYEVPTTAVIKNGEAEAKFEDIKVGDTVSGLRIKKADNRFEVVKITKFGPAVAKTKKSE